MVRLTLFSVVLSISVSYAVGVWQKVYPIPTTNVLNGVIFIDTGNGWVAGDSGTILRRENKEWNLESNPVEGTGIALRGIHFVDSLHGWAVGQERDVGGIICRYLPENQTPIETAQPDL